MTRVLGVASAPITATVNVPGSKSIANRALVCAALADGVSRVRGCPDGDDTRAMIDGLTRLGATIVHHPDGGLTVSGHAGRIRGGVEVDALLAGTTSRFLTAVASLGAEPSIVTGAPRLRARPMAALHDSLSRLGARVEPLGDAGCLPVRVARDRLHGGTVELPGDVSSQFVTALMLIAPLLPDGLSIRLTSPLVSRPYVAMTAAVMSTFGASGIAVSDQTIEVAPDGYRSIEYVVEPDASSASYPLAAAAITAGEVAVPGLTSASLQGDSVFSSLLESMGCAAAIDGSGTRVRGSSSLRGIDIDMADVSDLVPTLAAVAAFADTPTHIRGVGFIRNKESDRLGDLANGLRAIGCQTEVTNDGIVISPSVPESYRGAELATHHDHRLAMAWSLLALRVPGISLDDDSVVSKSWPDWWTVRASLVAGR
ncbi:MAG: 3-phosphoshikimate 1-carboxyvinyltransferase [Acidimicrobiales bacterium mtb01]|nr:3-phosphoshikimate 1-carboxyvinyltransferase [Actinomycetota bacterium]TEX45095.1 MAG: 3-phosphoshikimate 1-carboxyvinyltransferase [Acidimicrobiales bacterium mtb01]